MSNKLTIIMVLLIASISMAIAEPVNTIPAIPKSLHVYNAAGATYVDLIAHGCSGARYQLSPSHQKYDAIVSMLMAAQIAGKNVVLRYDGCNAISQGQIVGVYLHD